MTLSKHPKEYAPCWNCDAGPDTWEKKRRLPQIGQTYECAECGQEAYVYDASDPGELANKQLRPVKRGILTNLQFFDVAGDWPDSATEDLLKQGLDRMKAIDYHIVDREGLTQSEWAEMRDVDQSSVSENVAKAREKLE